MIVEFIQNISILVALTVVHQLIVNCWPRHSLIYKILSGVLFGGVGIIGMMAPVHFVPGVIFDGRSIIMSLAGLFGGPLVAIISGAMCVIYRFSLGGAGAFPGALVIVAAAGLGVLMYFLKRREPGFLRPLSLWAFGGLVHGIMLLLMLLIPGVGLDALEKITLPILLVYPVVTVLICRILIEHEEAAKSDEELREREELLARSQEIAHVGSWELDLTNSCLKWSDETYRIFGVKPQEFDATYAGFMKFVHPDDRAKVDAAFAASLREKECYDVEHRIVRKHTGEVRHVYERCAHERNGRGEVVRSVGIVQDITARRQVEEELKSAKETAEAASKYKSEFLNNVSHDLRTPMNAILGFSDVLRLAPLEEKYRKCAELMHEQSRYLLALVEDVLDTAMLESGKFKLKSEEFHLRALIEKVVETNRGTLAGKEVALSFEVKGEVVRFRGDPLRLRQIADNLLSNAIKYTDRGQIRVSLEIFPVETDVPVQWVSLSVRDTGFGIPAERLPHIYDPFTRLHEFYEGRTGGGVGLGLSIVKKLVQQMGGEIRVFSEVGKGTEFVVRLGLERVV